MWIPAPACGLAGGEVFRLASHRVARERSRWTVEGGRLVGIITDCDVRTTLPSPATSLAVGELRYLLDRLLVERVMTRSVITIGPDASIADAVGLVLAHRIGALPVMEHDRLAGIIAETDLLRAFATMFAAGAPTPARAAAGTEPGSRPAPREAGHTILVPLDGSPGSESVLPTVGELTLARGARVRRSAARACPILAMRLAAPVASPADCTRRIPRSAH